MALPTTPVKNDKEHDKEHDQKARVSTRAAVPTVQVKSLLPVLEDGGAQVALWERHPDHPNGEVFVAGENPVDVAETAAVMGKIKDGVLEKLTAA